ncbi:hypothetical protein CHS0354_012920 [Potamilus streckersoni]|uniref:Uncharacterized protein n=1 Tax=Potamilus streckersoni TaxID=2493646 RepID=A0AAE0RNR3_9BIVA|nr:hypothetical protein CHS0354_012920 [Potamilus streckersoni]
MTGLSLFTDRSKTFSSCRGIQLLCSGDWRADVTGIEGPTIAGVADGDGLVGTLTGAIEHGETMSNGLADEGFSIVPGIFAFFTDTADAVDDTFLLPPTPKGKELQGIAWL